MRMLLLKEFHTFVHWSIDVAFFVYLSDFEDVEHSDGGNYYGDDYAREDADDNDNGNYLCQECFAMRSLVVLTGSGLCP